MTTMDLPEFLLARIAEDQAAAQAARHLRPAAPDPSYVSPLDVLTRLQQRFAPDRVSAECDAKRRIVAEVQDALTVGQHMVADDVWSGRENAYEEVLQFLALPYADHPAFREEWRP